MESQQSQFSDYGKISSCVPKGFVLVPLMFLICVNDMPQGCKSNLFLYADDSCLMYQCTMGGLEGIEKQLNKDFENFCNWFVDNK